MTGPEREEGVHLLTLGTRLGPYEIVSFLGAGGMGEVYRARDTRLLREVAVKVLPAEVASDRERLKRFEREARAASSLNHPNIVTIYDVGTSGSTSYIAMELVNGESLRSMLMRPALPIKKLLPIAAQIAEGLARAHEVGIVHRDLKPENVMVGQDGLVKILDFGLAKAPARSSGADQTSTPTETATEAGKLLGTVGYMSPEQIAGGDVDYRSDQFSLGAIAYEMVSGRRAFQRKTGAETMTAILNDDPPTLGSIRPDIPTPLRWTIDRCLAKEREGRYASTRDLAKDLAMTRDRLFELSSSEASSGRTRRSRVGTLAVLGLTVAAFVGLFAFVRRRGIEKFAAPAFHQLTFRRGGVQTARFTPDGKTVIYAAAWDGEPVRLFSTRVESPESTPLVLPDADLAAVSSSAELLVLPGRLYGSITHPSSAARVPFGGGAPRPVAEGVVGADWGPDSSILVLIDEKPGHPRHFEYPLGKMLDEDNFAESPRLAPDGRSIAYYTGRFTYDLAVMDLAAKRRILSSGWTSAGGYIAWAPSKNEVWFAAAKAGSADTLRAVSLSGHERSLLRLPGRVELQDVSREGRVLLTVGKPRLETRCRLPGWENERDLSWFDGSRAMDLSVDGKTLLFFEHGETSGFATAYLRRTDGTPPQKLGEMRPVWLSPDGKRVVGFDEEHRLMIIPTESGQPKIFGVPESRGRWGAGGWFPDSRHVLANWAGGADQLRVYSIDVETGISERVAPDGFTCSPISSDGEKAVCRTGSKRVIYSFKSKRTDEIPGLDTVFQSSDYILNWTTSREFVLNWSADGQSLYIGPGFGSSDARIYRLDLASGKRSLLHELRPPRPAGLIPDEFWASITPDGGSYCYTATYYPNDLYIVDGLK